MEKSYGAHFFESVGEFITSLTATDQAKILAAVSLMQIGDFQTIYTKQLRGPIHELIVKRYRFVYFIIGNNIYFVSAFVKKSAKTPKREIDNAEQVFKNF